MLQTTLMEKYSKSALYLKRSKPLDPSYEGVAMSRLITGIKVSDIADYCIVDRLHISEAVMTTVTKRVEVATRIAVCRGLANYMENEGIHTYGFIAPLEVLEARIAARGTRDFDMPKEQVIPLWSKMFDELGAIVVDSHYLSQEEIVDFICYMEKL
jgi:hypothetical protein